MKPYVTALAASKILGVPLETVVQDISSGMDGNIAALIGAPAGGVYVIPSWELEGERLEMHRARLTRSDGDNVCVVSGQGAAPMHTSEATEVKG